MQAATRAFIDTVGKSEFLPVSAPMAVLGGVGRVDFDQLPAGTFSLVGEHGEKPGPGRVRNAFGQVVVFESLKHLTNLKLFFMAKSTGNCLKAASPKGEGI